ncbi:MAG: lipoyl synthase [Gammaproteobacteria bacterium]|nr:lipoyl synthase [Gammaproteobacteria bacterium]
MNDASNQKIMQKPPWIRSQLNGNKKSAAVGNILREYNLNTVCDEAACPNRGECFCLGTATFMIMGKICTRNCKFCNVAHGKPLPLNEEEPLKIAKGAKALGLKYVVLTSVDRDDLKDGGAKHFAKCIKEIRALNPEIKIEILTPDFKGVENMALDTLSKNPPNVFNHNIETVPSLYKDICPAADYQRSLNLLKAHKKLMPNIPTKSGMMLGLGENKEEIIQVLKELRAHKVDRLTLGQYLQPSNLHWPIARYVTPKEFDELANIAKSLGFNHVASGPMVRSSYHADQQE